MTKGELLFSLAKWSVKYSGTINLDIWDTSKTSAKEELKKILEKANCENIYIDSKKVMSSAHTTIQIPHHLTLARTKWDGNKLIFEYKEKNDGLKK